MAGIAVVFITQKMSDFQQRCIQQEVNAGRAAGVALMSVLQQMWASAVLR